MTARHSVHELADEIGVDLVIASTATSVTIRAVAGDDVLAEVVSRCRASHFDFAAVRDDAADRLLRQLAWCCAKAQFFAIHRPKRWIS